MTDPRASGSAQGEEEGVLARLQDMVLRTIEDLPPARRHALLRGLADRFAEMATEPNAPAALNAHDPHNAEATARQLQAQIAELETLYQTAPIGLALVDRDLRYLRVNDELAAINGSPVQAHIGRTVEEMIPGAGPELARRIRHVFETGAELRAMDDHGAPLPERCGQRYLVMDFYPVTANGAVFAVGACVRDVTRQCALEEESRRQREELIESEAKLARLFDRAPGMITIMEGPDHRYVYNNPAHSRAVGGRPVIGRTVREVFPELEGTGLFELADRVYRTGEAGGFDEYEATLDHGAQGKTTRFYRQIVQPWYDGQGKVCGLMGFSHDISREVGLRRAVEETRTRLQKVQDSLSIFVGLLTPEGYVLEANRASLDRAGLTRDEVIGRPFWEAPWFGWSAETQRRLRAAIARAAAGETVRYEDFNALAGDERILVEFTLTPITDETGTVTELVPSAVDITDRRAAERALIAAHREAKAANEAKSRFLAMMSHEIRTPLNGVLGIVDVLDQRLEKAPNRDFLGVIRDSGYQLLHVLDDVLDFSKIEAGALTFEDAPFRPAEIAETLAARFAPEASRKALSFDVVLMGGRAALRGDRHRVAQILTNILSNALKFTESGGVSFTVADAPGGGVVYSVQDSGLGMTEAQIARIFEEFTQGDNSTTRRFGGSGLGMSITRRLLELMGGSIDIQSSPGQGTTVRVALPLPLADTAPQSAATPDNLPSLAGVRVLAVDDTPSNRLVLKVMLEALGAQAVILEDGRQFLDALDTEAADVLLIDVAMPGADGIEVIREVRGREAQFGQPRRLAFAFTARVLPSEIDLYRQAGFDGLIAKPVSLEKLARQIHEALNGGRPGEDETNRAE